MRTWNQFVESKKADEAKAIEKEEEKVHKDLDGDDEEGESKKHKAKVFGVCKKCKKKPCVCN